MVRRAMIVACLTLAIATASGTVMSYVKPIRMQRAASTKAIDLAFDRGRARVVLTYAVPKSSPLKQVSVNWPRIGFTYQQNTP